MKKVCVIAAVAAILNICSIGRADVIGFEDFDGGAFNLSGTTNVFFYNSGGGTGGDVFGIVNNTAVGGPFDVYDDSAFDNSGAGAGSPFAGDTLGIAGQNTSGFFAMNDMDGNIDGAGNPVNNAVWSFDISSANSLTSIAIDLAAMGDFEASSSDGFLIEARIDGGAYQEIFRGVTDEAASKDYRAFDDGDIFNLNDPLELFIDGVATGIFLDKSVAATGAFDSFSSTLFAGLSGSNLDIRVSWAGAPSGSEPMGLDNITINGTTAIPEPASFAFAGLALAGFGLIRRRK